MRPTVFFIVLIAISTAARAAKPHADSTAGSAGTPQCPVVYLSISTGINDPNGLLGFGLELPATQHLGLAGGMGVGTWGYKLYLEGKYYLGSCQRGWAFGAGVTRCLGENRLTVALPTINGNENVTLSLKPQNNVYFSAWKYWTIGRRNNRVFLQLGYSIPLTSNKYDLLAGDPLTSQSIRVINEISPGGFIVAGGFSFGFY